MRLAPTAAGVSAVLLALAVSTASAEQISRYREFELGHSLAAVTAVTLTTDRDLKTLHSRPALLQQVEWRPRYMAGKAVSGRDSIDVVVFNFVDDRLYMMTVAYERSRTSGLTDEDMIASLTPLYGAPTPRAANARPRADDVNGVVTVAEWQEGDARIALQHSRYSQAFSLVITSVSLNGLARRAQATSVVMDAREAPARDAALAKQRADDERLAEEKTRTTNKQVFRP